jgi:hypothetical protein
VFAPYRNTGIEIWVAPQGAKSYTLVHRKLDYAFMFGAYDGSPFGNATQDFSLAKVLPGWSMFSPTAYANLSDNSVPSRTSYALRFTQMIFSKQPVPCPQV